MLDTKTKASYKKIETALDNLSAVSGSEELNTIKKELAGIKEAENGLGEGDSVGKEELLETKRDLLLDMKHYINRRTETAEKPEPKAALAMTEAAKLLEKNIKATEKELGVSPKKQGRVFGDIAHELAYGNRGMSGSEQYDKVISLVQEIAEYDKKQVQSWEEGSKLFEKEQKIILEMQKYLNTRLLKVREVNEGYTFSMDGGKDGKPVEPVDKTENRFRLMVQSYERLSAVVMEHAAKYRPGLLEFNKNAYNKILNPTYHINVNANVKPDMSIVDSYDTLQDYETQRRTDLKKLAVKKESSFKQQMEKEKKTYEFKGSVYSRELTESIITSIYAEKLKNENIPYNKKEFEAGRQAFSEKIKGTAYMENIKTTVKQLLDPVKNESKDFYEAKIDEKAIQKINERALKAAPAKNAEKQNADKAKKPSGVKM